MPLLLLAGAFLVAYAWPIVQPTMDDNLEQILTAVSWTVWAPFAIDFAVRMALANKRGRYVLHHWYDIALIALPMLRPLRLLRLIAFLSLLKRSSAAASLANRTMVYVGGAALGSIGLGALAVLDAEQDADGANITSMGDALWWATTTVTTVGYGDRFPVRPLVDSWR